MSSEPPAEPGDEEVSIPARRLSPTGHLSRAAKAPIGSEAERYHLAAAQAEALTDIAEQLDRIACRLDGIEWRAR